MSRLHLMVDVLRFLCKLVAALCIGPPIDRHLQLMNVHQENAQGLRSHYLQAKQVCSKSTLCCRQRTSHWTHSTWLPSADHQLHEHSLVPWDALGSYAHTS